MRVWTTFAIVVLVVILGVVVAVGAVLLHGGIGARTKPTRVEAVLALKARRLALRSFRKNSNPVAVNAKVIAEGRAHFADHCAVCHANDGSGRTEMGLRLYPRAPDMRLAETQRLTDGELFAIIENGVRFTGMPAWGDGSEEDRQVTWKLVHFIRRLPHLTVQDIVEMRALNPKGAEEWREELEEQQFLEGGNPQPAKAHQH